MLAGPDEYDGAPDQGHLPSPTVSTGPDELGAGLRRASAECPPTAVIDIGSGSVRAVVLQVKPGGGVEVMAQQRMNLDLISLVNQEGVLGSEGVASALDAVDDFVKVCLGYGVDTIHAVGTEALRASRNAADFVESATREFGLSFRVISGYEEAAYCFIGAVHGLPVSHGLMADFGGGSLEVVGFTERSLRATDSLPLGSLRLANRFHLTGRPAAEDLSAAFRYARECLAASGVSRLGPEGTLVASGGSVRLLSKLHRHRRTYPIAKMHGYCLSAKGLAGLVRELSEASQEERARIPGMNPERTHSIIGGAVAAQALLEHAGADGILVSGQGLREGLARHPRPLPAGQDISLPPRPTVRNDGLADLVQRFAPRYWSRGPRRADLARRLAETAWQGRHPRLTSSLQCAALLLDIGSSVDFYNRLERTAVVVARSDLPGFSHRESAQIAGMLLAAQQGRLPGRYRKTSVLSAGDKERMGQAAAILLAADELERRLPPDRPAESVTIAGNGGGVSVVTPAWSRASAPGIHHRWQAEFNRPIHICQGEP